MTNGLTKWICMELEWLKIEFEQKVAQNKTWSYDFFSKRNLLDCHLHEK